MSTELAENQDLGPLGYPHHHGVLGFWRIFYTNLKIAQGLRDPGPREVVQPRSDFFGCLDFFVAFWHVFVDEGFQNAFLVY